jgi:deoxyribonuclease IV
LRIGLHTSISGSLEKAALRASELGAQTFQIFSASPRMWHAGALDPTDIQCLRRARERLDLWPLVIHDNYLINLAASDLEIRARSILALRGELERAVAIGAEYLVAHPGNYRDCTLEEGIQAVVESIVWASAGLDTSGTTLLLECTAGAGAQIGGRLEELAVIRDLAGPLTDLEIGFCLDTCHLLVAGYDVATAVGVRNTIAAADTILGLDNVPVIHANDSKAPRGSHRDRHEHIGRGHIGEPGFSALLHHPKLRNKAFILETPRDEDGDEIKNLGTLKRLCRKSSTTSKRSN